VGVGGPGGRRHAPAAFVLDAAARGVIAVFQVPRVLVVPLSAVNVLAARIAPGLLVVVATARIGWVRGKSRGRKRGGGRHPSSALPSPSSLASSSPSSLPSLPGGECRRRGRGRGGGRDRGRETCDRLGGGKGGSEPILACGKHSLPPYPPSLPPSPTPEGREGGKSMLSSPESCGHRGGAFCRPCGRRSSDRPRRERHEATIGRHGEPRPSIRCRRRKGGRGFPRARLCGRTFLGGGVGGFGTTNASPHVLPPALLPALPPALRDRQGALEVDTKLG
jgi:hypothetical protein